MKFDLVHSRHDFRYNLAILVDAGLAIFAEQFLHIFHGDVRDTFDMILSACSI
jgi:hypothetical protein